jgi:transcriptional regulator with XRE-family HTH domain
MIIWREWRGTTPMSLGNNLGVGPRCASWLKEVYPANRGKLIARDFRVSESTVWRWLAGEAPTVRVLEEMAAKWGRPFLEYVFAGKSEPSGENLRRLIAIREELDRREAAKKAPHVEKDGEHKDDRQFSRAVPIEHSAPDINWADSGALGRAESSHLRALTKRLLEHELTTDPKPAGLGKALLTLRALLRIT